jgi:hypothetical protein
MAYPPPPPPEASTKTLAIIHLEDDPGWMLTVKEDIEDAFGENVFNFVYAENPDALDNALREENDLGAVIIDLRTIDSVTPQKTLDDVYGGVTWLKSNANRYRSQILIVTGEMNKGLEDTLRSFGISPDRCFDKGKWTNQRTLFVAQLRSILQIPDVPEKRLYSSTHSSYNNEYDSGLLYGIVAYIDGFSTAEDTISLLSEERKPEPYKLIIQVTTLGTLSSDTDIEGLEFFISCRGAKILPNKSVKFAPMMLSRKTGIQHRDMSFARLAEYPTRDISILVYHARHLLRIMRISIEVL